MPDSLRTETRVAIEAVHEALAITRRGVTAGDLTMKDARDLVTVADMAVEDRVRQLLTGSPGTDVIGEERGGTASNGVSPYWLVDPICGTRNFASGTPLYAINLAFVEDGQVTIAVVGDPFPRRDCCG